MPPRRTTPSGYQHGRQLRHATTPEEISLWSRLRRGQVEGVRFRRQHALGHYVVDFCAPAAKLIVEIDGGPHRDRGEEDILRSAFLTARGYHIIRFWNARVSNDIEGVVREIRTALERQVMK